MNNLFYEGSGLDSGSFCLQPELEPELKNFNTPG